MPNETIRGDKPKKSNDICLKDELKIIHLNDDCLLAVFSYLCLDDLIAIKWTCRRFESVACDCFRRNFRHKEFVIQPGLDETCDDILTYDHRNVPISVLYNFGHVMRKLSVRNYTKRHSKAFWKHVSENYPELKQLSVYNSDLAYFKMAKDAVSRELERLDFFDCTGSQKKYMRIVEYAGKLKRLTIRPNFRRRPTLQCGALLNAVPLLEEIHLDDVEIDSYFPAFVQRQRDLKKISINTAISNNYNILNSIASSCECIESISIEYSTRGIDMINCSDNIAALGRLTNLKELQFRCDGSEAHALEKLAESSALETLGLSFGRITDKHIRIMCKFHTLHTLRLVNMEDISVENLCTLIKSLKLKHFHIARCIKFNYDAVTAVISCSNVLESFTFVHYRCDARMGGIWLSLIARARKSSGAKSPLVFFQTPTAFHGTCPDDIRNALAFIELRKIDSFDGYLTEDRYRPYRLYRQYAKRYLGNYDRPCFS